MAASPERTDFPFDGEEEPLFADDLDDFGDDDIRELPPQMPSLAELSARQDRGIGSRTADGQTTVPGFDMGGGTTPPGDPANDQGPPLKKRKPILTLKIDRIFSEKGLDYIYKEFPKLKFKGKGHEVSDLRHLMRHYEHWANMLYPKMTFTDVTDKIEALAKKREFKTNLIRMRRRQARGGAATPPLSDDEDSDSHPPANKQLHKDTSPSHTPSQPHSPTHPQSRSPSTQPPTDPAIESEDFDKFWEDMVNNEP